MAIISSKNYYNFRLNEMEAIDQFSLVVKKNYLLVIRTFNDYDSFYRVKIYLVFVSVYKNFLAKDTCCTQCCYR